MAMTAGIERHQGVVTIFSGPHGAGKDTLEGTFRNMQPTAERIVRHITRAAAPGEVDGEDYHFVDETRFTDLVGQDAFIEYSTYPDCMAGTSKPEIARRLATAEFATLTTNFEEGLPLHRKLGASGLRSICFFISPVSRETMQDDPYAYIAALRKRMEYRARPADQITNKLAKAALYRKLYLRNESDVAYINNGDGNIAQAVQDITTLARLKAAGQCQR